MSNKNCSTQNHLKNLLSGEMSPNEKETLELHLANCANCRRNLALMFSENAENFVAPDLLKEKVKSLPVKADSASPFSFNWLKIKRLQIAFASVLLVCFGFVGFYVWQNRQVSDLEDVLRNGAENKNSIKLLAPEDNSNLSAEKIEFRWSEMQNVKTYTLVISDEKGDIIKEIQTQKTQIETSISALGLTKEKRYFWHVKAKLLDGLTSESGSRKIFLSAK